MPDRVHNPPHLIYSPGSQVVALVDVVSGDVRHPRGAVGVVLRSPTDLDHAYRVGFPDGTEASLRRQDLTLLAAVKEAEIGDATLASADLYQRVILRCVIGSQAYGLAGDGSDVDRRGVYLPTAEAHWSLHGVPEQLENDATQEVYWELQKFLTLALKANPNVLECLYSPIIETATPLGSELLAMRDAFLSRLVYQTFNGYVLSQFKKMQADLRNQGQVKWKHVMHLIRLLMSGVHVLRHGTVAVQVGEQRDLLLAIKRGQVAWEETERLRLSLHKEFDAAATSTTLPELPDYDRANALLVRARRLAVSGELP